MRLVEKSIRPLGDYAAVILNLDWEDASTTEKDGLCQDLKSFFSRERVRVITLDLDGPQIRIMAQVRP